MDKFFRQGAHDESSLVFTLPTGAYKIDGILSFLFVFGKERRLIPVGLVNANEFIRRNPVFGRRFPAHGLVLANDIVDIWPVTARDFTLYAKVG